MACATKILVEAPARDRIRGDAIREESRGITPDVCGVRCQTRLPDADPAFNPALGEFRAAVGTQLAHIAAAFGLDVEEPLSSILPAPDQDADTPSPRTPREIIADHGWSGNLEPPHVPGD
jgi:hypothetical protein